MSYCASDREHHSLFSRGLQRDVDQLHDKLASSGVICAEELFFHTRCYADAIKVKQNTVLALIASPFAGVTQFTAYTLSRLAKDAGPGRDSTAYGDHSTRSFYLHHAGAISMAIIKGVAHMVTKGIDAKLAAAIRRA